MLLSPVQAPRGKPSSASGFPRAGLSIRITSHQPDSISPDQSPSKDPRDLNSVDTEDPPLPSPDPVIIHSQALPTPDGSPLGPPPYQPPGCQAEAPVEHPSTPDQRREVTDVVSPTSTEDSSAVPCDRPSCTVPRTLSAPVAQVAPAVPGLARSESLSAVEKTEDTSTLTTNGTLIQDLSEASEEPEAPNTS